MSQKVEIDVELLSSLVEAAGWVGTFYNMFHNGETPENCGDINAVEYLASEAALIEQRGKACLEAVEQSVHPTDGGLCENCHEPLAAAALHEHCFSPATISG